MIAQGAEFAIRDGFRIDVSQVENELFRRRGLFDLGGNAIADFFDKRPVWLGESIQRKFDRLAFHQQAGLAIAHDRDLGGIGWRRAFIGGFLNRLFEGNQLSLDHLALHARPLAGLTERDVGGLLNSWLDLGRTDGGTHIAPVESTFAQIVGRIARWRFDERVGGNLRHC